MPGNLFRRGTLLILTGPVDHLHIVMNDPVYWPERGAEMVLIVNISSIKEGIYHDPSCVLQPGCHPFVRVPSWTRYKDALISDAGRLGEKVDEGECRPMDPVSWGVYEAVRAGFDVSRHVTGSIKRFLRQNDI